jgi:hypothetical protein
MHRSKIRASFDHLVSAGKQRCRDGQPERLGSFKIDHQLVLGWRLYRQVTGFCACLFGIASFPPSTYRRGPDFIFKETQ